MTHEPTDGDAYATARTEFMSTLAGKTHLTGVAAGPQMDHLVELFVATLHSMPTWALRKILERRETRTG